MYLISFYLFFVLNLVIFQKLEHMENYTIWPFLPFDLYEGK